VRTAQESIDIVKPGPSKLIAKITWERLSTGNGREGEDRVGEKQEEIWVTMKGAKKIF